MLAHYCVRQGEKNTHTATRSTDESFFHKICVTLKSHTSYAMQLNLYIFKSEQGADYFPILYRNYHFRFGRNWVFGKVLWLEFKLDFLFHWNNGQNSESDIFIVLSWIHTTFSTFIQLCFYEWKNNNKQITQTYTFTQAPSIFGYTSQLTICVFVVCVCVCAQFIYMFMLL